MQTFATVQDLADITQQPVKTVQGRLALQIATARIVAACGTTFADYLVIPDDVRGCCLQLAAEIIAGANGLLFERIDDYSSRVAEPGKSPGSLALTMLAARYGGGSGVYMIAVGNECG